VTTALAALSLILATPIVAVAAALGYALVVPLVSRSRDVSVSAADPALSARLSRHVAAVASVPHNVARPTALEAAARHIETTLASFGYVPLAQAYTVDGVVVRNIEVALEPPGADPGTPTYIVGAHYDSPDDSPGANDNGTGVAAALELARSLKTVTPRTARLRIVFWVNEELPYGKTPDMGSWRHARMLRQRGETVLGVIALETLGHFSDRPGSQQFPFPFGLIYPNTGNFVAFVGLPGSRRFTHRATRLFRRHSDVPAIGGIAPGFIPGIDLSDHWAYHQFGYPALMLTDTAPFRNPYYHQPDDLPHTVDYATLARVTTGVDSVVRELIG
jgi:hypothetical protein